MKIPNYDSKQKKIKNIKLCDFLDEDFRMLIAGQTRCGKTNTLMHMISKLMVFLSYALECLFFHIEFDQQLAS